MKNNEQKKEFQFQKFDGLLSHPITKTLKWLITILFILLALSVVFRFLSRTIKAYAELKSALKA